LTIDVTVYEQGVQVYKPSVVTTVPEGLSFAMPFSLVQSEKELKVQWVFNYLENATLYEYNNYTNVEIVASLVSEEEILKILGTEFTSADAVEIERSVRLIIQAHTGQSFGKFIGHKTVSGSGEGNLRLPARLLTLKTINGNSYWNTHLALRGNGWFLQNKALNGPPSIRADYYGWHETPWVSSVPIGQSTFQFVKHSEYTIDGTWGWDSVPSPVSEAARLLINDYACRDANYRDRFLTSMTAADWRIQFHDGAFSNTGNVRANQLLTEYVLRRGWVVI
jgi:hypothetical protein